MTTIDETISSFNLMHDERPISNCHLFLDDTPIAGSNHRDRDDVIKQLTIHHPELTEKVGSTISYLRTRLNMSVGGGMHDSERDFTVRR